MSKRQMSEQEIAVLDAVLLMRQRLPLAAHLLNQIFGKGFAPHYAAWRESQEPLPMPTRSRGMGRR